jgi:hypothetical protein
MFLNTGGGTGCIEGYGGISPIDTATLKPDGDGGHGHVYPDGNG